MQYSCGISGPPFLSPPSSGRCRRRVFSPSTLSLRLSSIQLLLRRKEVFVSTRAILCFSQCWHICRSVMTKSVMTKSPRDSLTSTLQLVQYGALLKIANRTSIPRANFFVVLFRPQLNQAPLPSPVHGAPNGTRGLPYYPEFSRPKLP